MIIDCHCHLSFLSMQEVHDILKRAPAEQKWVLGGYQPSEWESQAAIRHEFSDRIYTCFGLHPWFIKSDEFSNDRDFEALKIWSDQADFIGEVGLDFFGDASVLKKDIQIHMFEKQLELARHKPIVFHIVQAHGKALEILKDHSVRGFVHSFSGSIEVAEQYVDQGLLLSFGNNILNENYIKAKETVENLPLESILVESDTPSHALDDGDPLNVLDDVYGKVAEIKNISVQELKVQVQKNFKKLLTKNTVS